ncbi:MAG TPA: DUF4129 domain-containing protein [Bryobacteraceae bacterium]|nr:DUF4129 domain-containing protein [Bryobacteraceae bacterium]
MLNILLLLVSTAALEQQVLSPKPLGVSVAIAKHGLKQILAQPEFSAMTRQPNAWDRLKTLIGKWTLEHLHNLFKAIAQHPTTSQIVFWIAAVGAVGLIAFLLFRLFARDEGSAWIYPSTSHAPQKTSADWILAARSASQSGQLNTAIQCLYWAAVLWLETAGVLAKTNGLTPRELLRTIAAGSEASELRNLTSSLERFWYGRSPATPADFAACLRSLEALGCPLE